MENGKASAKARSSGKFATGELVGAIREGRWYVEGDTPARSSSTPAPSSGRSGAGKSAYGSTRTLAKIISLGGWLVVASGVLIGLVLAASAADNYRSTTTDVLTALGFGLDIAFAGIVLVAAGHVVRATVDTADNTARIAELLQRR